MNVGSHAESAELEPIVAPMRLEGDAPIGRQVEQPAGAKRIGAQIVLRAEIKRAIGRCLEIEHVVYKSVGTHTPSMRSKGTVDYSVGRRRSHHSNCRAGRLILLRHKIPRRLPPDWSGTARAS
jgi:hypothetical protein